MADEAEEKGYINNLEVFTEWSHWYLEEWEEKKINYCVNVWSSIQDMRIKSTCYQMEKVSIVVVLWKNSNTWA